MNLASAGANGNSGRSGAICSEILPFSVERERLTESFPDIACALLPAFEIVSCPPFDGADLLAEEEVRNDDSENECDGREEEVGERHEDPSIKGIGCVVGYR